MLYKSIIVSPEDVQRTLTQMADKDFVLDQMTSWHNGSFAHVLLVFHKVYR